MIGDENFAKAFAEPQVPYPRAEGIYTYNKTGNRYRIKDECKMKIESGEWVEGIIYMCVKTGLVFTRDKDTFIKKFTKADE